MGGGAHSHWNYKYIYFLNRIYSLFERSDSDTLTNTAVVLNVYVNMPSSWIVVCFLMLHRSTVWKKPYKYKRNSSVYRLLHGFPQSSSWPHLIDSANKETDEFKWDTSNTDSETSRENQ